MKIRIVLEGGPRSGKTSAFKHIALVEDTNYALYKLPEVASCFFADRSKEIQRLDSSISLRQFYILRSQILLEDLAMACASKDEKALIIQDRGVFDSLVYLKEDELKNVIFPISPHEFEDSRYDLVVFFRGAHWNDDDRTVRVETSKDETDRLSKRAETIWASPLISRRVVYIEQQPSLREKAEEVVDIINEFVGEQVLKVSGFLGDNST